MTYEISTTKITPEFAKQLLNLNNELREYSEQMVQRYKDLKKMIFQELQIGDYFKSPKYEDTEIYMKIECYLEGSNNAVGVMDELIGPCVRGWGARLEWNDEVILVEKVADIPERKYERVTENGQEYLIIDNVKHPIRVEGDRIIRMTPQTPKEIAVNNIIIKKVMEEFPPKVQT